MSINEENVVHSTYCPSPIEKGLSEQPSLSQLSDSDNRRDKALDFLAEHKNEASIELSKVTAFTRRLRRKIDWRVMPFFCLCYTMNFLDKVLLNYANIMGLSQQLHLTGSQYSHASASFYIAVLFFSLANIWVLNRLPVAKCLAIDLWGWGLTTACHAALRNNAGLVTLRVISGAFESGIPPALMLLCSQYFTYYEQALRFSYWYMGMSIGQMSGGLISFAFQHVPATAPLSSWKMMFLILGLLTVALGIFVLFFVPDSPMDAKFLTNDEKVALLEHIRVNQTGIENKHFHPGQLLEGLCDVGCWGIFLIIILQASGSGVVTAYSATILTSFGYTSKHAALLNIPSGAVNMLATLGFGYVVRHYGSRWLINVVGGAVGTTGACLLSFLPHSRKGGLLAGIYLINFLPGATAITFQWLACNTAGHTKRTYATAGMNAAFAIGNIIGPETFQARDAPEYKPAKLSLAIMWAVTIVVAVLCRGYYAMQNAKREKKGTEHSEEEVTDRTAYAGLTDKQNHRFRYHL